MSVLEDCQLNVLADLITSVKLKNDLKKVSNCEDYLRRNQND